MTSLNPPLSPKDGKALRVLTIARISTAHQDERSLADQVAKCNEFVRDAYQGEVRPSIIHSQGSGEHIDRREYLDAMEKIESGQFDLVIAEDLARVCRRQKAYDFCELCQDANTRLIAINDRVDTAIDGWQDAAFISTWHHERSNRDTSQRIRRSLRNRFIEGGVVQCPIYGYIKKPARKETRTSSRIHSRRKFLRNGFDGSKWGPVTLKLRIF